MHPAGKLAGKREDPRPGASWQTVDWQGPFLLPPFDGAFIPIEVGGNLFPGIEPPIRSFRLMDGWHNPQCPQLSFDVPCRIRSEVVKYKPLCNSSATNLCSWFLG